MTDSNLSFVNSIIFTLDVLVIIDLIYLCTLSLVPAWSCRLRNVLCDRKWRNTQTSMTNITHWTSGRMHPLSHRVTLNHSTVTLEQFRKVFAVLSEMTVKLNSGYVSSTNKFEERLFHVNYTCARSCVCVYVCARARARARVCMHAQISKHGA